MVLSIRKVSFENEDLAGTGIFWFKDLNEPDPYLILPIMSSVLNYINLGVSDRHKSSNFSDWLGMHCSEESPRRTNTGLSIDFVVSSRSSRFSTCHLPTSGQQVPLSTGSHLPCSYWCSKLSLKSHGSSTKLTQTFSLITSACMQSGHQRTTKTM